ncbi:MAG TPA: ADOP family duplicated permease [Bryobacteraceae bacterium]|nr:ADOP family duplicated permease [Bryobacteraceae bacterium]
MQRDLQFALRLMVRQPLLTGAAVLTVAFGVGANTAVLSVLETVLLNPLGMRHNAEVMVARVHIDKLRMRHAPDSGVEFRELHAMTDAFSAVAAMENRTWTYQAGGQAMRLLGQAVTPEFFQVFGAAPALGRFPGGNDPQSLVISYEMWQAQFGGDAGIIGRAVMLDGAGYRVVGVAPKDFRFPADCSAWSPLILSNDRLARRGYNMNLLVLARLRTGVTAAQAAGRVNRYIAGVAAQPGGADLAKSGYGIELDSLAAYIAGELHGPLWLLWTAAFVVLLTGCANVAGLLLTRSWGRRKEIAVRISVGATRWQIVRQLLLESLTLGLLGGLAGLGLARLGLALVTRAPIPGRPALELVTLDGRMLLYGMALATASAMLFGLAPALQLLRDSQISALARSRRRRFQDVFVTAEVAGAFVLVVVTGLLLRSLWNVEQIHIGFDPQHLTTAYFTKPQNDPGFQDRLLAALKSAPGVESAALAYPVPFGQGGLTSGFSIRNRERRADEPEWHGEAYMVSPEYLHTLRIPLRRGRNLSASDTADAPMVCLIDRNLAQQFFPNQDPIGQQIAMYRGWAQIVGVVGNTRADGLETVTRPVVYYSLAQIPFFPQRAAVVRSGAAAGSLIRETVRRTNRAVPVFDIRTMQERIGESLGIRRVMAALLSIFGGIGLLLATVGIYGVIAQMVAERTQEVGIRMALGARPAQILAEFTRQGLRAGALGLAAGAAATAAVEKWVAAFLYQVRAFDGATLAAAAGSMLALLLVAAWVPARRAAKIDPQAALRHE